MKWYNNLYLSEGIAPRADQIVNQIKNQQLTPNVYVIAPASNPKNLLDVIPSWELMQPAYPKQDMEIIGISDGKKEALELVEHIVGETYEHTGSFDIRIYLREKWGKQSWM